MGHGTHARAPGSSADEKALHRSRLGDQAAGNGHLQLSDCLYGGRTCPRHELILRVDDTRRRSDVSVNGLAARVPANSNRRGQDGLEGMRLWLLCSLRLLR